MDDSSRITRIPPHDSDAEAAVLSCMLTDKDSLSAACERLAPEDFYNPQNAALFRALLEMYAKSVPVDAVTVSSYLKETNMYDAVGGAAYVSGLIGLFYAASSIKHYNNIVAEKSVFRRLVKASENIADMAYASRVSSDSAIETAEKLIFEIAQNRRASDFAHIKEPLFESIERIELRYKSKERITGVPSGFAELDDKTAGFQPSDLILVAARPSMGKTAFALNAAQNAALSRGVTTAVFSLEMSAEQVANRLLCSQAVLDAQKIRTGELSPQDWRQIAYAAGAIAKSPIYIDDTPGITVPEVRAKCRKLKIEKNLGLIIIDYLQLMGGAGRSESRQQEISEISRSLKALAREIGAPVIALSQLSRAPESRSDHRPMLSDLRESGAIEQDADVVMFIYREEYYFKDTEKKNQAEIIIAKQRNGPTGTVDLMWLSQYAKFTSVERHFNAQ
ncbi:MAG: replicative DNA helicase [Clostridiales bacterium]|jgi:replicative DNA helicase|nr:replicative DNA helicase [Clostridiales bacterium]